MSEHVNASAFGAAGLGLPGAMWALDHLKVDVPKPIVVLVLIISAACILVSLGLWIDLLFKRFGVQIAWPFLSARIPFHVAARHVYEAAEKAGILSLTSGSNESPDKRLNHFKLMFMIDDKIELFGVKPPSTKPTLIPKADLQGQDLYPVDGENSQIGHVLPLDADVAYVDVTVARKDVRRVIKELLAEARELS
jgi:hypothetical protein